MKKLLLLIIITPILVSGQSTDNLNKLTPDEKVMGLSKIWKEVEYNFAYFEKLGTNKWDSLYLNMISSVQKTNNDYEYFRELQRFISFLHDGHSYVRKFSNINLYTTVFYDYYIEFGWLEGKVVVTRISADRKDELHIGTVLVEVNSMSTLEYLNKNVIPYISASTEQARMNEAAYYIFDGLKNMEYSVKFIKPNKEELVLKLQHGWNDNKEMMNKVYPPKESRDNVKFTWLDNDIAYLAINTFSDSSIIADFKKYLPELYKAKKLVLDLRENRGGNTEVGLEIFKYFTSDSLIFGPKMRARKHISSNKANGSRIKKIDATSYSWEKEAYLDYRNALYTEFDYEPYKNELVSKKIVIPTYILIGYKTISAAEDFLVFTKNNKHIKTICEKTAGSTGSPYFVDLPNNGQFAICTLQSYYPDGSEYVGVGIVPDIEVKRTISGLINMKDEVLEKALELLKKQRK